MSRESEMVARFDRIDTQNRHAKAILDLLVFSMSSPEEPLTNTALIHDAVYAASMVLEPQEA